jgi:hypothetical protein
MLRQRPIIYCAQKLKCKFEPASKLGELACGLTRRANNVVIRMRFHPLCAFDLRRHYAGSHWRVFCEAYGKNAMAIGPLQDGANGENEFQHGTNSPLGRPHPERALRSEVP